MRRLNIIVNNMNSIIEVFRMKEVSEKARARIIIKLGKAINDEHGMNITDGLVFELVSILDKENPILKEEHFLRHSKI